MLAGATGLVGPGAIAAPVGSAHDLSVSLGGVYRFNMAAADQAQRAGFGRGYAFKVDEVKVIMRARHTADNGISYGTTIDLQTNTNLGSNADEAFAFVNTPWGRLELGDQDDASSRMFVEADNAMVGRKGFDGDVADFFRFGSGGAVAVPGPSATGDAAKAVYFSPRFAGLQLGASLTPDSGGNGASTGETDNDGDFENVLGLGINYVHRQGESSAIVSLVGELGAGETASGADAEGDLATIAVGALIRHRGFAFGAGYVDFAKRGQSDANIGLGEDSGEYWNAAIAYRDAPWGISLGYFASTKAQPTGRGGDTTVDILSLDGEYRVAAGWSMALSINFVAADNINGTADATGNDGAVVVLSTSFFF